MKTARKGTRQSNSENNLLGKAFLIILMQMTFEN